MVGTLQKLFSHFEQYVAKKKLCTKINNLTNEASHLAIQTFGQMNKCCYGEMDIWEKCQGGRKVMGEK